MQVRTIHTRVDLFSLKNEAPQGGRIIHTLLHITSYKTRRCLGLQSGGLNVDVNGTPSICYLKLAIMFPMPTRSYGLKRGAIENVILKNK